MNGLLELMRAADDRGRWIMFLDSGFTMADAGGLFDRGIAEISQQDGKPAIRFTSKIRGDTCGEMVLIT